MGLVPKEKSVGLSAALIAIVLCNVIIYDFMSGDGPKQKIKLVCPLHAAAVPL